MRIYGIPVIASLLLSSLAHGAPAGSPDCDARRAATGKLAQALFACEKKAAEKGVSTDPGCIEKASTTFVKAFAKAGAGGGCGVEGDPTAVEGAILAVVEALRSSLRPGPDASAGTAAKLSAVGKYLAGLLGKKPKPLTKLNAGLHESFAKAEAKGALTTGDEVTTSAVAQQAAQSTASLGVCVRECRKTPGACGGVTCIRIPTAESASYCDQFNGSGCTVIWAESCPSSTDCCEVGRACGDRIQTPECMTGMCESTLFGLGSECKLVPTPGEPCSSDENDCTTEACDATGVCTHTPDDSRCYDLFDPLKNCSTGICDVATGCDIKPKDCPYGCDPATGCNPPPTTSTVVTSTTSTTLYTDPACEGKAALDKCGPGDMGFCSLGGAGCGFETGTYCWMPFCYCPFTCNEGQAGSFGILCAKWATSGNYFDGGIVCPDGCTFANVTPLGFPKVGACSAQCSPGCS